MSISFEKMNEYEYKYKFQLPSNSELRRKFDDLSLILWIYKLNNNIYDFVDLSNNMLTVVTKPLFQDMGFPPFYCNMLLEVDHFKNRSVSVISGVLQSISSKNMMEMPIRSVVFSLDEMYVCECVIKLKESVMPILELCVKKLIKKMFEAFLASL